MTNNIKKNIGEKISEKDLCPDDLLDLQIQAYMRDIKKLQKKKHLFVNVSCPACGSKKYKFEFEKYKFSFQKCKICQTIFMSPRPTNKIMTDYYTNSENYQFWSKYIFPISDKVRKKHIQKLWYNRIKEYLKKNKKKYKSLLEIGSGFGTFGMLIDSSNFFQEYIGIEPSPELYKECKSKGLKVYNKMLEDFKYPKKFDIAVSFEVIEHIFNPKKFLICINNLLKNKGLIFLSCPNGQGFDIKVLKEKSQAIDSEHVNLFNTGSIGILLERTGYKLIDVFTPGRLDVEIVREEVIKNNFKVDSFLKKILIEKWDEMGWEFQKFLSSNNLSSHMWVVAEKISNANNSNF